MRMIWGALASIVLTPAMALAFSVPQLTGPVMDQANVLSPPVASQLDAALRALNQQKGTQIVVLTVPSLDGMAIEQVSMDIVDQWKLGTKDKSRGLLFLIAPKEHQMRIEVGRDLEGVVPDIYAKRIISDTVTPFFQGGKMDEGIVAGVMQVVHLTDPDFPFLNYFQGRYQQPAHSHQASSPWGPLVFLLFLFLFLMSGRGGFWGFLLGSALGSGSIGWGGGGWGGSGGGFGGGGFGGGGGGFNGGGASGSW